MKLQFIEDRKHPYRLYLTEEEARLLTVTASMVSSGGDPDVYSVLDTHDYTADEQLDNMQALFDLLVEKELAPE